MSNHRDTTTKTTIKQAIDGFLLNCKVAGKSWGAGQYDGSIFVEGNRVTYEFILLRNVYSFLMIILLLLDYLLDKQTFLKKELPDAMSLAKDIGRTVQEIGVKLAKLAK